MVLSSIWVIVIIVGTIIVALVAALISHTGGRYESSRLKVFVTVLSGLGVFITFFFYYNVVQLQAQGQHALYVEISERVDNAIIDLLVNVLPQSSTVTPVFTMSLLPLEPQPTVTPEEITPQVIATRWSVSMKVFSIWQDYVTYYAYLTTLGTEDGYIYNFLQRATSEPLHQYWIMEKSSFQKNTIEFGDLLFEFALRNQDRTVEGFRKLSQELINDVRYLAIIRRVKVRF